MIHQCPHCGQSIGPDANFCSNCGGRLTMSAKRMVKSPVDGARSPSWTRPSAVAIAGLAVVATVAVALGYAGTAGPRRTGGPGAPSGTVTPVNLLQNPSLEDGTESALTCWLFGGFGTNTSTWTRTPEAHSGSYAEALEVTALSDGDVKLVTTQDEGACAPGVTAGAAYVATAWYTATAQPVLFAYYRDSAGQWVSWTQSPPLPASPTWRQASFTTPAVPAGATRLSVGLGLNSIGSVTMDDFDLVAQD